MTWLSDLQRDIRTRFGMESPASDKVAEHIASERLGEVGIKIGDLTSHRTPPERCWLSECMEPAEGMLCRRHRVDAAAYLHETDPIAYVWDWISWTIEMEWAE